ncbi:MAG TPA: hypothetical protein VL485_29740 [Ktedonobacteraceae bacterium]|nr:hypothetical protein [Ktedonobacteraceae bacterium]
MWAFDDSSGTVEPQRNCAWELARFPWLPRRNAPASVAFASDHEREKAGRSPFGCLTRLRSQRDRASSQAQFRCGSTVPLLIH